MKRGKERVSSWIIASILVIIVPFVLLYATAMGIIPDFVYRRILSIFGTQSPVVFTAYTWIAAIILSIIDYKKKKKYASAKEKVKFNMIPIIIILIIIAIWISILSGFT